MPFRSKGKIQSVDIFRIIGPTKSLDPSEPAILTIPEEVRRMILSKNTTLFIYGKINFREISGAKHYQRFAIRYAPGETDARDMTYNCGPRRYWKQS